MQEKIIAAIPQGSEDTALEVALIQDDHHGMHVELRYLAWSAGVGWYRQHTLRLDRPAARTLLRALGYVRNLLGTEAPRGQAKKVIPLPVADRARVAMGAPVLQP
jgi:hypothetical protein